MSRLLNFGNALTNSFVAVTLSLKANEIAMVNDEMFLNLSMFLGTYE